MEPGLLLPAATNVQRQVVLQLPPEEQQVVIKPSAVGQI
jgi:hypothetical protein